VVKNNLIYRMALTGC